TVEKAMAIAGMLVTGAIAGTVLFAILRAFRGNYPYLLGVIIGVVVGAPVALISRSVGQTATAGPITSSVWILATSMQCGAPLGRISAKPSKLGTRMAQRINPRQFLIRRGGPTAVITVVGAVVGALVVGRRKREVVEGERWSANHSLPNAAAEVKP